MSALRALVSVSLSYNSMFIFYSKIHLLMTFSGWLIINVRSKFGLIGHCWFTRSRKLNLSKLWDILAVYAWIDTGVDYIVKVGD